MKKSKKWLSILLCAAFLIGLLPTVALAAPAKVSFNVSSANATGTVSYRFGSEGDFTEVGLDSNGAASLSVDVPEGAKSITVKAVPNTNAEPMATINQGRSGIYSNSDEQPSVNFNFTEVTSNKGFTYTFTGSEASLEFRIEFDNNDGTSSESGGETGTTSDPTNYEGAKAYIEGWDLAYYGGTDNQTRVETVRTLMTTELWHEGFSDYNGHTGDYTDMFNSFDAFKAAITLSENPTTNGSEILDLPYYTYTVMLHDDEDNKKDVTATGKVYVLETATQFGVKIGDSEYHLLDTSGLSDENVDLYVQSNSSVISNIKVFGNGVCTVGSLSLGSGDGWAAHITQEHSGIDTGIGCRLVVLPKGYTGVKIASDVTAAAWDFAEVPIFATGSNSSPVAEIFCGNDGTTGRTVTISQIKDSAGHSIGRAIDTIAVDPLQVNPNVAKITKDKETGTFTVTFNSGYDVIPLNVTYKDENGTYPGKLTIHRVAMHLESNDIKNGNYQISHGTDKFVSYKNSTENAQKVVTAAFYYSGYTGETKPSEHISLFVTIQTAAGTTHKVVTQQLNSDFIATTGNDKWADDFLLWSGTESDYANLISISAIAYSEGEDGSFGGVKAGSGTGVEWVNK